MRNLTGYLKKILLATSLCLTIFFPFNKISAQEVPFNVTSYFVHKVNGKTVNTELTLNLVTDTTKVLSLYTVSIQIPNIKASCFGKSGNLIKCESYNRTSTTDVQMDLRNSVVGPENPLEVKITYSYELQNEVTYSFPSKVLDATTSDITILYPKEKGDFSWTSENIISKELKGNYNEVVFKNPQKGSVSIFFDKQVLYSLSINRQFNNGNEEQEATFELVVPLDDYNQTIIWESIDPLPASAIQDDDGNYIFKYLLKGGESVSAKLSGYVLKEKTEIKDSNIQEYLSAPKGFWELKNSTEVKRVATFMKEKGLNINPLMSEVTKLSNSERELFYKLLYQYVIYRLDYPKDIVLGISDTTRLGTTHIIENPLTSTQIDYADFYMMLLRNYGIASRLIIGYVSNITDYTSDGFYHYWIEYYDKNKEEWIQADPFVEEYFGHNIFGTNLNDHITILKRGKSPMAPTLTFYSPTDFIVQMSLKSDVKKDMSVNSDLTFDEYDITKKYAKAYITTSNTGNVIISKVDLFKSNIGNLKKYIDSVNNSSSVILLPKQTGKIQLNIPTTELFFKKLTVTTRYNNNAGETVEVTLADEIPENIPLYTRILSKVLSLLSFAILIFLLYTILKLIRKRIWIQQ